MTRLGAFRTLTLVRRFTALLLVPSLLAISGRALHTHTYDDHDHPEHQHGLAFHEHLAVPTHRDDRTHRDEEATHVEGCDPGEHAVELAFISAAPQQPSPADGDISVAALVRPVPRHGPAVRHVDVRAHGPPSRTQASPRAPPLIATPDHSTASMLLAA